MVNRRLPPRRKHKPRGADFDQELVRMAEQGRSAEVVAACEVPHTHGTLSVLGQHVYGVCLLALNRADSAVAVLEAALASLGRAAVSDPRQPVSAQADTRSRAIRNDLSKAYFAAQRYDKSIETLTDLVDGAPDDIALIRNLIMVLEQAERIDEAVTRCRFALDHWPSDARLAEQMGDLMVLKQDWEAAGKSYARSLESDDSVAHVWRRLVSSYRRLGDPGQVAGALRDWLSSDPGNPVATHLLAAIESDSNQPHSVPARASAEYVRQVFDRFAETFDDQLSGLGYAAPGLIASLLRQLELQPDHQLRVLDAGCGTGRMGEHLRPFAKQLQGVDLSQEMLTRAIGRGYDQLECADLVLHLIHHPLSYDLIVAADTLIYFGDLHDVFLATFNALVANEATFVFSLEKQGDDQPERESSISNHAGDRPLGYHLNPSGRYCHRVDYVRQELESCGFGDVRLTEGLLRREADQEITGLYWTARKRIANVTQ